MKYSLFFNLSKSKKFFLKVQKYKNGFDTHTNYVCVKFKHTQLNAHSS